MKMAWIKVIRNLPVKHYKLCLRHDRLPTSGQIEDAGQGVFRDNDHRENVKEEQAGGCYC